MMKTRTDYAVSPVVGVMLMLVVVVIIAAVVSGFAGGLLGGSNQKAPTLTMDVNIVNNGYWAGSQFSARVTGVEGAVSTKDLKIVTKWAHTFANNGTRVTGGATVLPNKINTHLHYSPSGKAATIDDWNITAPQGFGSGVDPIARTESGHSPVALLPGVVGTVKARDLDKISNGSWFGNYGLQVGTSMWAEPFGGSQNPVSGGYKSYSVGYGTNGSLWQYVYGSSGTTVFNENTDPTDLNNGHTDGMQAVLGYNWYVLRAGDTVDVSVVHIPSGKTIWQRDVVVED